MMSPHPLLPIPGSRSSTVDGTLRLLRCVCRNCLVLHSWGKIRDVRGVSAAHGGLVFLGAAAAGVPQTPATRCGAMLTANLLTVPARAEETTPARPSFERLRQDEGWSALCDPARRMRWFDALKCVPLSASRATWLSLGGEVRERYEYTHHPLWGGPQDKHGVFLQRYILHSDLHLGPHLRLFGQLYSALEDGRRTTESKRGESARSGQGFLDLSTLLGAVPRPRCGSGGRSCATARHGSSTCARGRTSGASSTVVARIAAAVAGGRHRVRPTRIAPGVFDDDINDAQALWGVCRRTVARVAALRLGARPLLSRLHGEGGALRPGDGAGNPAHGGLPALGRAVGMGLELGVHLPVRPLRTCGHPRLERRLGDGLHGARAAPWSPRLGLSANIASGDRNPADHDLQTFNPLFPRGNYFSELALLGPRNFFNLHPALTVHPTARLSLTADVDCFWRLEHSDGIYSPERPTAALGPGERRALCQHRVLAQHDLADRPEPKPHRHLRALLPGRVRQADGAGSRHRLL